MTSHLLASKVDRNKVISLAKVPSSCEIKITKQNSNKKYYLKLQVIPQVEPFYEHGRRI